MRKKIAAMIMLVIVAMCVIITSRGENGIYYEEYKEYKYGFFPDYSSIKVICSDEDKEKAETILSSVKEELENINASAKDKLSPYTFVSKDIMENTEAIACDIELLTAKFTFSSGYIWFKYRLCFYGEAHDEPAVKEVLAYMKVKKQDNSWQTHSIRQQEILQGM